MFFRYNGENMSLVSICNRNKKRRGRTRYLFSVIVDVVKVGEIIPAKVVYVRNHNKCKEYLCLIFTDINLDENAILCLMMQRLHISQLFLPDIWCHWKAVNPMITGHLGSFFYIFLTKCLISHGYKLFKCCPKCSDPCLRKTPNYWMKKSLNWWMHLWMYFLYCWKRNSKPLKVWTLTTE